jgi:hypothetical protein
MSTQKDIEEALAMGAKAFHGKLVSGLALGRGAKVSTGALECEARVAKKAGDLDRAATITLFLDEVYKAEASAVEVYVDGNDYTTPGITPAGAKFFLGRNRAVSKLVCANGRNEFFAVDHRQFWKSTVAFKELVLAMAIASDSGPGDLPSTLEEASAIVASQLSLAWPGYVAAVRRYVEVYDKSGHDSKLWHGVLKAHQSSVTEWIDTVDDRSFVADAIQDTLEEAVSAAVEAHPKIFEDNEGPRGRVFCAAWAPSVLHFVDVEVAV